MSIGLISEGIFTLSMIGSGILLFVGVWGGGMGIGIYQLGISWYCYVSQFSISLYWSRKVQLGINLLNPILDKKKPRFIAN